MSSKVWKHIAWATGAGVTIGGMCALSPSTAIFALAMAGLLGAAGRGLTRRERTWVVGLLSVAILLRLLVIAGFVLLVDHERVEYGSFFGDGLYAKQRSLWLRNIWMGIPVSPLYFQDAFNAYGWTGYHYFLGFLQVLLGPMPYGVHLLNVVAFLAAMVLLHRVMRSAFGAVPALAGLAIMLFMPTLFVWSVSELKESSVLLIHVVAFTSALAAVRANSWWMRFGAMAAASGAIIASGFVRNAGTIFLAGGLALGLAARLAAQNIWSAMVALLLVFSLGGRALRDPGVQHQIEEQIKTSAVVHMGHFNTKGFGYKLLDERFYVEGNASVESMTLPEGIRFVTRALISFVVVPLPWQSSSLSTLIYLPQQLIWYVVVFLSIVGLWEGWRRDALVTFLLAGMIVVGGGIIALNSGNIGTMVRHRDMVVPFFVCLAGLGGTSLVARFMYVPADVGVAETRNGVGDGRHGSTTPAAAKSPVGSVSSL